MIAVAVTIGVVFAGYVGYVQFQERARAAPDIPFERLPLEERTRINQLLEEGATFTRFGDPGSALMLYREAYGLHPRNRAVVTALESLFTDLAGAALARGERVDLQRLDENLRVVMATDDFLGNRPVLVRARAQIGVALPP